MIMFGSINDIYCFPYVGRSKFQQNWSSRGNVNILSCDSGTTTYRLFVLKKMNRRQLNNNGVDMVSSSFDLGRK